MSDQTRAEKLAAANTETVRALNVYEQAKQEHEHVRSEEIRHSNLKNDAWKRYQLALTAQRAIEDSVRE